MAGANWDSWEFGEDGQLTFAPFEIAPGYTFEVYKNYANLYVTGQGHVDRIQMGSADLYVAGASVDTVQRTDPARIYAYVEVHEKEDRPAWRYAGVGCYKDDDGRVPLEVEFEFFDWLTLQVGDYPPQGREWLASVRKAARDWRNAGRAKQEAAP